MESKYVSPEGTADVSGTNNRAHNVITRVNLDLDIVAPNTLQCIIQESVTATFAVIPLF